MTAQFGRLMTPCGAFAAAPGILLLLAGCAAGTQVVKTVDDPAYHGAGFGNILVIAAGENYDARAQFERQIVSGIRAAGASATAWYTIAGDNPPLAREDVIGTVRDGNYDGVLFSRVSSLENTVEVKGAAPATKVTRRSGTAIDLFRYDYEDLNEPDSVEVCTSAVLITELYAVADEKKIWAIESSTRDQSCMGALIDAEVEAILGQLRKDGLIGG